MGGGGGRGGGNKTKSLENSNRLSSVEKSFVLASNPLSGRLLNH